MARMLRDKKGNRLAKSDRMKKKIDDKKSQNERRMIGIASDRLKYQKVAEWRWI